MARLNSLNNKDNRVSALVRSVQGLPGTMPFTGMIQSLNNKDSSGLPDVAGMVEYQEVWLGSDHKQVDTNVEFSAVEKKGRGEISGREGGIDR